MSTTRNPNEVPEIPPEIQNRRPVAMTRFAAEDEGLNDISLPDNEAGLTRTQLRPQQVRVNHAQIEAINELCSAPAGFEPAAGMPAKQVFEIMGRNYPNAPKQDPFFGDRTPEFIVWMYENHPVEAHIRYLSRLMPDAGRWIAKNHPKFVYKPNPIRVALPGTTILSGLSETVVPPNSGGLTLEKLQHVKKLMDENVMPHSASTEVAALRARIAQLEAQTPKPKKTRGKAKAKPAKASPAPQPITE